MAQFFADPGSFSYDDIQQARLPWHVGGGRLQRVLPTANGVSSAAHHGVEPISAMSAGIVLLLLPTFASSMSELAERLMIGPAPLVNHLDGQ